MKRNILCTIATAAALALVLGLSVPATAQGGGGGGRQGGGRQGGFGPGGFGGMMRGGMMGDPTTSNLSMLLMRDDVRSELGITAKQREQMDEAQKKARDEFMEKMRTNRPDFQSLRDLPEADRAQKMQEMRDQMQAQQRAFTKDMDKKAEEVLTPGQIRRLHELDIQMRGPLALAEEAVASKVGLTPDQNRQVSNIVSEYRTAQQETMRTIMGNRGGPGGGAGGGAGAGGGPGGGRPDPQVMQARMAEMQKENEKNRKASGDKIAALLTAEQKQTWQALQGKKFTFRSTAN